MPYATPDDVFKAFPAIASMVGTGSLQVSTTDVASIFIARAEGIVNAYLGARYQLPLNPEPILTSVTADIATYKMVEDNAPRIPTNLLLRYTNATSLLSMIRDGQMILTGSQTVVTTGDQEAWATEQEFHPVFSPVLRDVDQRADGRMVHEEYEERRFDHEEW